MFPGTLPINFSTPFFINARALITTSVFVCHILSISVSRSLHFDSFSTTLMEVFLSVGMATSIRVQILSLLSLTMMSSRLADIVLSVWMSMSHRMVMLSFSTTVVGGVVVPFVSSIYIVLPADLPIEVSCDLVVPLDIFCLSKLRAIRHEVFQSFFIAITCTESAMSVSTIFYEVVVVRSSGKALILCHYDESLRFRFKPGAFEPLIYFLCTHISLFDSLRVLSMHCLFFPFRCCGPCCFAATWPVLRTRLQTRHLWVEARGSLIHT